MASILSRSELPAFPGFAWRRPPLVCAMLASAAILLAYADTVASMVAIWWRSETFAHGFLVVPISVWLAWRRREAIAAARARPFLPALVAVAAAGALWLVATLADVLVLRQFALVFLLQASIVAITGLAVARAAALPLLFLLFAPPAGEALVPTMIEWTADFTVAALRLSGVPVFREGNHFVIPSGSWSVVEACSGLRYLIASFMIGVLYASVCYRSAWRRLAFIAASIVVPLIANWLRAYLIVMLGHLSDNRVAVGIDHLIYGWIFFGLVMALLFWLGSLWSETPAAAARPASHDGTTATPARRFALAALASVLLGALWPLAHAAIGSSTSTTASAPPLSPIAANGGFAAAGEGIDWRPAYRGAAAELRQAFERDGAVAQVHIGFYRNEVQGRELVSSGNVLVAPEDSRHRELERRIASVRFDGRTVSAARSIVSTPGGRLVAWKLYWIDGRPTSSDYAAKALLAWSKLSGGDGDGALIVVYAHESGTADVAREALEALSGGIARTLEGARGQR